MDMQEIYGKIKIVTLDNYRKRQDIITIFNIFPTLNQIELKKEQFFRYYSLFSFILFLIYTVKEISQISQICCIRGTR